MYILAEEMNSPSVRLIREHMKSVMPEAKWHTYEPVDRSNVYEGTKLAFGKKLAVEGCRHPGEVGTAAGVL